MPANEKATVQIGADTKEAKSATDDLVKHFEGVSNKMADIEQKSATITRGLAEKGFGAGGIAGSILGAGLDPTQALSGQAQQLTQQGLGTAGAALGSIIPGIGPVIGKLAGDLVGTFVGAMQKETAQVEAAAAQQTKSLLEGFAISGVGISDAEVAEVMEIMRGREKKMLEFTKRIAKVQDDTSESIFGYIGGIVRRGADLII